MPYNNITSRSDAEALIPEDVSKEMLGKAVEDSAVLRLFRRINVPRKSVRFPILSALPVAYWVNGDTGLKQTTEMSWTNKFLTVEEIATILPIPENVADDIEVDVWDEAEPFLREAVARLLDETVFFGTNAPSSFPTAVFPAIVAAGNTVAEGTATAAQGGYMGDLDNLLAAVEEDGFNVTGYVADLTAKRKLRSARDTQGRKLDQGRVSGDLATIDGVPVEYAMSNLWPTGGADDTNPRVLAGDWRNQFVVGVRQDITFKMLDQAVIQDNTGAIVFNLAQQDMVAMRLKFRVGWQVANTINNQNPNASTRYPAAALVY